MNSIPNNNLLASKSSFLETLIKRKGRASNHILPFDIKLGDRVLVICRVSWRDQHNHLNTQDIKLTEAVEARGGIVIGRVKHVGSGFNPSLWLGKPALAALDQGAILLAATTDRFVRERFYTGRRGWCEIQASAHDLECLRLITYGAPLMTFLHPDASPGESRSLLTKWGQAVSGNKGGRPWKNKEGLLARVVELAEQKHNPTKIVRILYAETNIHLSADTVKRWLKLAIR